MKGFSKLDLQNNSPTKSGQEDKVISIYIMMLVMMMMMTMIVMTMMMLMMMVSGVGWSGSKSCSSPIRPSTWTNVSKSSGDHDDDCQMLHVLVLTQVLPTILLIFRVNNLFVQFINIFGAFEY